MNAIATTSGAAKLPRTITDALRVSVTAIVAALNLPQLRVDAGIAALVDELSGTGTRSITDCRPLDRVLTPKQTADLLGRSTKTVCGMAKRGLIRAVRFGAGGKRASGYSEASVRAFLAGEEVAA